MIWFLPASLPGYLQIRGSHRRGEPRGKTLPCDTSRPPTGQRGAVSQMMCNSPSAGRKEVERMGCRAEERAMVRGRCAGGGMGTRGHSQAFPKVI